MRLGNALIRWMSQNVNLCPPHEWRDVSHEHDAYGRVYLPNHVWPDMQRRR
jgi:hypothetical protein